MLKQRFTVCFSLNSEQEQHLGITSKHYNYDMIYLRMITALLHLYFLITTHEASRGI